MSDAAGVGMALGREGVAGAPTSGAAATKLAEGAALFRPTAAVVVAALLLVWPAVWNGYPLVFADSGTYVAQVPTGTLGWDRPPFYSGLLLLLHWRLSLWPAIAAQALAAAWVLLLALRAGATDRAPDGVPDGVPDGAGVRLVLTAALLAVGSSMPWFAAQVMPDVFTGLLVIALALLAGTPERLTPRTRRLLAGAATVMITLHLSHLLLAVTVPAGVLLWRRLAERGWCGWAMLAPALLPPVLAAALLVAVNLAGHGRASLAPFSSVFLLARLLEDGPARIALDRECNAAGWALCGDRAALPPTADAVLWSPDSPLQLLAQAGTDPRTLAGEAAAIVGRTWRTQPAAVLAGAARATLRQLSRFATGDGLRAWPLAVTPQLARVLPARELAAYARARQTRDALAVPAPLRTVHVVAALAALLICALLLFSAGAAPATRALALATLVALPVNAAVTGALSGPHDRYQSRVMWLPLAVVACAAPRRLRTGRLAAACA